MTVGRFFAIGEGRSVRLFCENRGVKDDVLHGYTVNGAWDFTMRDGMLKVLATGESKPAEIVWSGDLPGGLGDYGDKMEYIESRLGRWRVTNWFIDRRLAVNREYARIMRACGAAKRSFKVVYNANSKFVQDEDDTIPF